MLDGSLVMLHPDSGKFFTLGDTGLAIWRMLDDENEVDRIVQLLVTEYEIDADSCRAEVDRFTDQLVAAGFAEIR
jgi:hypothetical protein